MPDKPLISIILPTHNGQRYLAQSIASCIAQTCKDWELIVVDDCSTDDTPRIIESFVKTDPRIRSIRHEKNKRLPGALNSGFALARGDLLTWTSDDNLFRPEALEVMDAFLHDHRHTGMVYCDFTIIDEVGREVGHKSVGEPAILAYHNDLGACFLYRRGVHEKVGAYAEDLFCAEDYDYWLRIAEAFPIAPLHRDLYLYRVHGQSLTSTRFEQVMNATADMLYQHLPRMTWAPRWARAEGYLVVSSVARQRKRFWRAGCALLRALACAPRQTLSHVGLGAVHRTSNFVKRC